jgi:hypothetical protein
LFRKICFIRLEQLPWSPDSQLLAFNAQIDGPSTDLYIYKLQDQMIQRLTDDLENTVSMEWSPDGKWILYVNQIPGIYGGIGRTFYITDMDGNIFQIALETLPHSIAYWSQIGWMSDTLYLFQAIYNESPQFRQLVLFNTENKQLIEVWPYSVKDFRIDVNSQSIVLLFESENDKAQPESGIYRISTSGNSQRISDQKFYRLEGSSQIIVEGIKDDVETAFHITSDNAIIPIGPALSAHSGAFTSPDKNWFFIDDFYKGDQRITLYSKAYQLVKSWTLSEYLIDISWRPDSLGIFLFTENNIYYMDIPNGEPKLLDMKVPPKTENCDPVTCIWARFTWRP